MSYFVHIHIVRHGLTEFNVGEPRFRGQLDIPLSEAGIQQAEALAEALKRIKIDKIYYSRLQRAKITAEVIKKFHPTAQLIEEPFLLTLNFGDWQGRPHKEVFRTAEERNLWYTNPNAFVIPNGETFYEVLDRIHRLFIRLQNQSEKQIALITHRIVIISILLYIFKLDPSHFWDFHVDTASISQIDYNPKNGTFHLVKLNDIQHLKIGQ
ncbi:MAG: histidine phosphatase family protein [Candidatus Heimdallarchaeota archaeon]|nr:MAG: histidine phosphatase family protein [Candidatus Heimdallarchaeota archaeon]